MRVLQLGPYPPPCGGVQSNLVAIRSFLRKRGIPCAVINITRHRKPDADQVYYPSSAFQLLWLLLRLRYDIIHLHIGGMLTRRLLRLGLVCTLMPGRKSVLSFHSGGYPSTPEGKSVQPHSLAGFVLRRFDRVIGVNPEIMEFLQRLGLSRDRTRLIYPYAFLADQEQSGSWPEAWNTFFDQHRPLLISVGLLEPEYELPLQIKVLGKVQENFPGAGLVIIGSGSLEEHLRRRIQEQPYAEHILLCGDVPHAATMQATARADVMLRTTLYDGDAVSVREGLHLGTPVIATDNGMRPAGVHLIPKSNLDTLRQAIEQTLAAAPASRPERAAPDESNLQAVLELYEELLGRKIVRTD
jgi:glycosyltransferase involved in cell wall biosynthesis